MNTEQFYELWEKFATSNVAYDLPDNLEQFCEENGITFEYFLMEFV